jgi:hypothetical protein
MEEKPHYLRDFGHKKRADPEVDPFFCESAAFRYPGITRRGKGQRNRALCPTLLISIVLTLFPTIIHVLHE